MVKAVIFSDFFALLLVILEFQHYSVVCPLLLIDKDVQSLRLDLVLAKSGAFWIENGEKAGT